LACVKGRSCARLLRTEILRHRLSENVFKSELHLAHGPGCSDLPKSGRLNIGRWWIVIRMIDEIERLEAKFERVSL